MRSFGGELCPSPCEKTFYNVTFALSKQVTAYSRGQIPNCIGRARSANPSPATHAKGASRCYQVFRNMLRVDVHVRA